MYKLLLDSDALIKASKAEFLEKVTDNFDVSITEEVYNEAVKQGRKEFYQDADKIDDFVNKGKIKIIKGQYKNELKQSFGIGEKSTYQAYRKGAVIITDDLKFTAYIKKESIKSLSSAHLIYALVKKKKLSEDDAFYCLEKLKPYIRKEVYELIKKDIGG